MVNEPWEVKYNGTGKTGRGEFLCETCWGGRVTQSRAGWEAPEGSRKGENMTVRMKEDR